MNFQTPLSRAAEKGDEKIVDLLLEHNAEPQLKDMAGETPMSRAIQIGNVAVENRLRMALGKETPSK